MVRRRIRYWTVLETRQLSGTEAVRHVSQQGFTYYHPLYREPISWKRREAVRLRRSLFPGYLFVEINPRLPDWHRLHSTRGVSRVMMTGMLPARVSDEEIERLQSLEDEEGYVVIPGEEPPVFNRDDIIIGTNGLHQGQYGVYQGLGNARNARRVLFEILGRSVEFEVSVYSIEKTNVARLV
jgi:transcriptional antiterminator RfaH